MTSLNAMKLWAELPLCSGDPRVKTCFVIMPYGSGSEERRKHFLGVYQSIIIPAVARAGYEPSRSDISQEPGNITHSIIRSLLNSDLVIADLTEANAKVFFELGIRHAFRKSGTIHIVDEHYLIPFDIGQYRAIKYSNNLASLPAVIDEIVTAISLRETQVARPDNPVHDAVPSLPIDIRTMGDEGLRQQITTLQESYTFLLREKDQMQKRLDEIDPTGILAENMEIDVDKILDQAGTTMMQTGRHVLLSLAMKAQEGGADVFVRELRSVLKNPFLSNNDLVEIANMCSRMGLEEHRRATLEIAASRDPRNDDLLQALAGAYLASASPVLRDKARVMLEKRHNIEYKDGEPALARPLVSRDSILGLALLTDSYMEQGKPEWVLSLMSSAEKYVGRTSRILRNKARALAGLGRSKEAEVEYKNAIEADPNDNVAHSMYSGFLEDQERYEESYAETEKSIITAGPNGNRIIILGIDVLNHGYVRDSTGEIIGPIPRDERLKFSIPLFLRAMEVDPSEKTRVVGILVRANAINEAQAIEDDRELTGNYRDDALRALERAS
jgi:tetratricopeptide (TPR) repeat protein